MSVYEVDATLLAEGDTGPEPLSAPADASSSSGRSLAVQDPASRAHLADLVAALASKLAEGGTVEVGNFPATQPVSAVSLPLPAGAATEVTLGTLLTQLTLAVAKLSDIFGAVDGLEVTAENIDISNTSIGLDVDEVESLLQQIRDNAITLAGATSLADLIAKGEAIRALLAGTLTVQGTATVAAADLDIRDLRLTRDSVRQTPRPMKVLHTSLSIGGMTTATITPGAGQRIRVLRIDGGCSPATDDNDTPTYAINLDIGSGDQVVRGKTLSRREPLGCTVCLEGVANAVLTVSITGSAGTVEFDIYYELF